MDKLTQDRPTTVLIYAVVLCLLGFVCYANCWDAPFIFDDHGNIVGNRGIDSLWPSPEKSRLASRRPIGHLTFALNHRVASLEVRSYHVVNFAIHLVAGLLLFGLVRRSLELEGLRDRYGRVALPLAFAVAAIWLVHPLQTSCVTYVVQRLESLMAMFYLLSLYGVLRGSQSSSDKSPNWVAIGWYLVTVVAFWIGLFTKEVMATGAVVLPLYDRIFLADSWRTLLRRRWAMYLALVPALVAFAVVVAPALSTDSGLTTGFGVKSVTPVEYLSTQAGVLLYYLRLVFWPHPLCLDYAWPVARSASDILIPGLVIVVLVLASLWALYRWPRIGFLGTSFFLILAPTSSFVPIKELAVEYRMYLPLAAVVILFVLGTYHAVDWSVSPRFVAGRTGRRGQRRLRLRHDWLKRVVSVTALFAAVATLAYLTRLRNNDYRSEKSIWEDTVRKRPDNSRAYLNLGNVYLGEGDYQAAIRAYSKAAELRPDDATPYNNRGRVYRDMNQRDKAMHDFNLAVQTDPQYAKGYHNRGNLYLELGEYQQAIADHTTAIKLDPEQADSYFGRGNSHLQLNKLNLALEDYTAAIQLQSHFPEAFLNRGSVLLKLRRFDEAVGDFTRTIEQDATLAAVFSNRALGYYYTKQYDRAWEDVRSARRLGQPVHPQFIQQLSSASGRAE